MASRYLDEVESLRERWRESLRLSNPAPRADAAAWALLDVLPAHPLISAPVAAAATGRSKPAVYQALEQLERAGVLLPLSAGRYGRSWEAAGMLELMAELEDGEL